VSAMSGLQDLLSYYVNEMKKVDRLIESQETINSDYRSQVNMKEELEEKIQRVLNLLESN
jgi:hypothetical protein